MIPTGVGEKLRTTLADAPVPAGPEAAEKALITVLSVLIPNLAEAPVPEELRPAIARLIQADGSLARLGSSRTFTRGGLAVQAPYAPGDLAKATLLTIANSPHAFRTATHRIADIPYASMYPILEDAPHYLLWIGAQGFLGTVPPWCAIVAADLGRRIRWRRCAPPRGSGRLLWMCEQMATPFHADEAVPLMWKAARARGITSPDWPSGAKPTECRLDDAAYTTLLRDRLTDSTLTEVPNGVTADCATGLTLVIWTGRTYAHQTVGAERMDAFFPNPSDPSDTSHGAALFSRRGDHAATGWLNDYRRVQDRGL
jgi:helicase